jgi:sulfite exporter TauE/SafE
MGFAGSLHCAGMCSPLVMTVANFHSRSWWARVVYNTGRILTYGLLGALVGVMGIGFQLAQFQNIVSIILGAGLVIAALAGIRNLYVPIITPVLQKFNVWLKSRFWVILQRRGFGPTFLLGLLNGLLPCGLTFLALAYTLTLETPVSGFLYMLLFGLGTFPVMLGLTTFAAGLIRRFDINVRKLTTSLMFVSGCLLIVRVFLFHEGHAHDTNAMIDVILCK